MAIFTGSGVALATPFNDDYTINYKVLEELIEFQIKNKTDAIIICGTTGEASVLTDDEQIGCIRRCVEIVNKRIPVIAGTGSNDTLHGAHLTKKSKEVGADAALIVTPYYNKTTQKGLIEHYEYIASKVDMPIILYSVASRSGLNIEPETVYKLSKVDNIVGIKEASGNISQIADIASLCGEDFTLYSGNDDQTLPIMALGGKGVISTAANVIPKDMHDCATKFLEGDIAGARALQLKMIDLCHSLFVEVNPIPVKAALSLLGYQVGRCKMPLTTMEEKHLEQLKTSMVKYGLL